MSQRHAAAAAGMSTKAAADATAGPTSQTGRDDVQGAMLAPSAANKTWVSGYMLWTEWPSLYAVMYIGA